MTSTVGALSGLPAASTGDPAIAAIERHREAKRAYTAALLRTSDAELDGLFLAEQDACVAWLMTPPTTIEGVIATLEHAAVLDHPDDFDGYTHLLEGAHYSGERLTASEQFPAMIAAALRKMTGS